MGKLIIQEHGDGFYVTRKAFKKIPKGARTSRPLDVLLSVVYFLPFSTDIRHRIMEAVP